MHFFSSQKTMILKKTQLCLSNLDIKADSGHSFRIVNTFFFVCEFFSFEILITPDQFQVKNVNRESGES